MKIVSPNESKLMLSAKISSDSSSKLCTSVTTKVKNAITTPIPTRRFFADSESNSSLKATKKTKNDKARITLFGINDEFNSRVVVALNINMRPLNRMTSVELFGMY